MATERRFREVIRDALLANRGRPQRARRALDDHGSSSLYDAVREVEAAGAPAGTEREGAAGTRGSASSSRPAANEDAVAATEAAEGVVPVMAVAGLRWPISG